MKMIQPEKLIRLTKDEFICPVNGRICSIEYCESFGEGAEIFLKRHNIPVGCSKKAECLAYQEKKKGEENVQV